MADNRPGAAARIIRWIDYRLPFVQLLNHELNEYPTPRNLNYWWNYGSLAGIMLVVMIVTGIFLAMQYTPSADLAFDSVERIMRDVNFGWLLRYAHMNGASMFFRSCIFTCSAASITVLTRLLENYCGFSASSSWCCWSPQRLWDMSCRGAR